MESSPVQRWLSRVFQCILISVPKLAAVRISADKISAFAVVWYYLWRTKVSGDYMEFGVFEGMSFNLSMRSARRFFKRGQSAAPRFFAFDSFQGLPENHENRDSQVFQKGAFRVAMDLFKRRIRKASKGWDVRIVPGFYDRSLTEDVIRDNDLQTAAFVNIDCDLYESTLCALRFVTPLLRTGSVIFFDDWHFSRGDMSLGEPGACADWLRDNPKISLIDFGTVGFMGKFFIVHVAE